jgi:hypothetical protein
MDLLYFLKTRLDFTEQLYDRAILPFEETKRLIDDGEPPYVDNRDPEDFDEPAFLAEYQQADESIMVIGHWALCMVQASLQAYLKACIGPHGSFWWKPQLLLSLLAKRRSKDWFHRYQILFLEDLGIDWNKSPIPISDLEQLNLTRNDLMHNVDMLSMNVARSEDHSRRFSVGLFTDDLWAGAGIERVKVTKQQLRRAIDLVYGFCSWIETARPNNP